MKTTRKISHWSIIPMLCGVPTSAFNNPPRYLDSPEIKRGLPRARNFSATNSHWLLPPTADETPRAMKFIHFSTSRWVHWCIDIRIYTNVEVICEQLAREKNVEANLYSWEKDEEKTLDKKKRKWKEKIITFYFCTFNHPSTCLGNEHIYFRTPGSSSDWNIPTLLEEYHSLHLSMHLSTHGFTIYSLVLTVELSSSNERLVAILWRKVRIVSPFCLGIKERLWGDTIEYFILLSILSVGRCKSLGRSYRRVG